MSDYVHALCRREAFTRGRAMNVATEFILVPLWPRLPAMAVLVHGDEDEDVPFGISALKIVIQARVAEPMEDGSFGMSGAQFIAYD